MTYGIPPGEDGYTPGSSPGSAQVPALPAVPPINVNLRYPDLPRVQIQELVLDMSVARLEEAHDLAGVEWLVYADPASPSTDTLTIRWDDPANTPENVVSGMGRSGAKFDKFWLTTPGTGSGNLILKIVQTVAGDTVVSSPVVMTPAS